MENGSTELNWSEDLKRGFTIHHGTAVLKIDIIYSEKVNIIAARAVVNDGETFDTGMGVVVDETTFVFVKENFVLAIKKALDGLKYLPDGFREFLKRNLVDDKGQPTEALFSGFDAWIVRGGDKDYSLWKH